MKKISTSQSHAIAGKKTQFGYTKKNAGLANSKPVHLNHLSNHKNDVCEVEGITLPETKPASLPLPR